MGTKPNFKPSHPGNQVVDACNRSTGKKSAICLPRKHVRVLKKWFKPVRVLVQLELGKDLEVLIFELRPENRSIRGKTSEQGRELTTNSTHI